jgi:hypothetical protein
MDDGAAVFETRTYDGGIIRTLVTHYQLILSFLASVLGFPVRGELVEP